MQIFSPQNVDGRFSIGVLQVQMGAVGEEDLY